MKTFTFKTNINCGGCIAKVTPVLETLNGIQEWKVDTGSKDKIMEVQVSETIMPNEVIDKLQEAGFKAELL